MIEHGEALINNETVATEFPVNSNITFRCIDGFALNMDNDCKLCIRITFGCKDGLTLSDYDCKLCITTPYPTFPQIPTHTVQSNGTKSFHFTSTHTYFLCCKIRVRSCTFPEMCLCCVAACPFPFHNGSFNTHPTLPNSFRHTAETNCDWLAQLLLVI